MRLLLVFLLAAVSLPAAPIAHWSFDGATGPERLQESYGSTALDLLEAGTPAWAARPGFGEVFVGSDPATQLRTSGDAPGFGSASFTIALWSFRTGGTGSVAGLLDALSGTGTGWQLFYQANDALRIRLDDDAGNSVIVDTSTPQAALATWRSIIVTVDRTADLARIFVDGVERTPGGGVDIAALTGGIDPDQTLWIGTLNGTSGASGRLDDLALFDRLLDPAEIATLAEAPGTPILDLFPPAPPLPAVSITPASGLLHPNATIALDNGPSPLPIHYTLDGSEPTAASPLYSAPFTLPGSGTVHARTVDGQNLGPVAAASFVLVPAAPPNVVLIVADDLGFNDLGCYGVATVATPQLDALAYAGCRFTQLTNTGPGDLASQYALLTGRLVRRAGLPESVPPAMPGLDSREWTLAEALRKADYDTAFIGEWHLGDTAGSTARDQGFGLFHGLPSSNENSPPVVENDSMVDPDPNPVTLLDSLVARAETYLQSHVAERFFLHFQPPRLPADGSSLLGDYGNEVEALDAAVGRLLAQLDTLELAESTLVVFLSDEGADRGTRRLSTGSNGQLRDGRGTTWEGGVRPPMIVRWPSVVPAGITSQSVLWMPDLHPTLAELAAAYLPADRPVDGASRPATLLGVQTQPDPAQSLYLHRHTGSGYELSALRDGPWKLHLAYNNSDPENTTSAAPPLLYNVAQDPTERIDKTGENPGTLSSLQQLAAAHEATFAAAVPQLPDPRPPFLSEPSVEIDPAGGTMQIAFLRPADSLNDWYVIQHGDDLATWSELAVDPYLVTVTANGDNTESVQLRIPLDDPAFSPPRHFLRLQGTRP